MLDQLTTSDIFVILVSLLVAMVVHEFMHGYVAFKLGDTTALDQGRLTLNPLKHVDLYTTVLLPLLLILLGLPVFLAARPVPFNPDRVKYDEFGSALVGIAGPLTNLALATVVALFLRGFGPQLSASVAHAFVVFVSINVAIFVFNLIPFPPLDGSRLLFAFAPEPVQKIMLQLESGGMMTIFVFIMVFLYTGLGSVILRIDNSIILFLLGG